MRTGLVVRLVIGLLAATGPARAQGTCGDWARTATPDANTISSRFLGVAAVSATDVWAVGDFDSFAGQGSPLFRAQTAHWDGSTWTPVPTPEVGPSGTTLWDVAAAGPGNVWAVGYWSTYGTPQTLVQRWDGERWNVVPSPVIAGGSSLQAVTLIAEDDGWAVGLRAGGLPELPATVSTLIVHWNGSDWTLVPSPNAGNRRNDLVAVSGASADDVWAVGCWRDLGALYQNLAVHWDGTEWRQVPVPNEAGSENELMGVAAIASDDVWAVGRTNDGVTERSVFLHWDGSAWSRIPGPGGGAATSGSGTLLALASDDVWAVGSTLAHWDGSEWKLVPGPVMPEGTFMALQSASRAGSCDVWAAGITNDAQGQRTLAIHLTSGPLPVPPGPRPPALELTAGPNPFSQGASIRVTLAAAADVRVEVLDASGRRVQVLLRGRLDAGRRELGWDGRDSRGAPVSPGAYFVRASLGDQVLGTRLLRIR